MNDQTVLVKRSIDKDHEPTLAKFAHEEFQKAGVEFTISNKRLEILDIAINKYIQAIYEHTTVASLMESRMPTAELDKWITASRYEWMRANAGHFMWFKRSKTGIIPDGLGKTTREVLDEYLKTQLTSKP